MKILIACEESQAVTIAMRNNGHEAYSCDLLPCSGGRPEWHYKCNIVYLMNMQTWDLIIAFPPCTDLAVSGAKHFKDKRASGQQQKSIDFFMFFANWIQCPIAIENPVGIMSTFFRKPDQIIQPWQFGHKASKKTCLWLRGLPLLNSMNIVGPPPKYKDMTRKELAEWTATHRCPPGPLRSTIRSKTYPGIAQAMADQWAPKE